MTIPLATVTIRYEGFFIAVGGTIPKVISLKTPPATPVIVERIIIPTMSALCSIALNAPVTANAIVPNKSNISINKGDKFAKMSDNRFSLRLPAIKLQFVFYAADLFNVITAAKFELERKISIPIGPPY